MSAPAAMPDTCGGIGPAQLANGLLQNVAAPQPAAPPLLVPTALLWLRRDLRVSDNPALVASLQGAVNVVRFRTLYFSPLTLLVGCDVGAALSLVHTRVVAGPSRAGCCELKRLETCCFFSTCHGTAALSEPVPLHAF